MYKIALSKINQSAQGLALILALAAGLAPLASSGAKAQAVTFDTTGTSQVFGIQGVTVGTWTTNPSLFTISTPFASSGTITSSNEIISSAITGYGNVRMIGGSYGAMWRNDGTNTYLLFTGAGNQYGVWNALRPFYANDATGMVNMGNGLTVVGGASVDTLVASSTITAAAYYHNSDARLKTDIHPIQGALDKILSIRGVEFNWKKDGHADMGVVAQNVAEVFPHVIAKDQNGIMSVEYDSLVGPMIEAIRELRDENDSLRKKVAAFDDLRAQMADIRASLQVLKQDNARLRSIRLDDNAGGVVALKPSETVAP